MTDFPNIFANNVTEAVSVFQSLGELAEPMRQAATMAADCLTAGHKLMTCGNGGSASDASHLATEFVCRFQDDRRPYPAIALGDVGSTLTAIANDYDFEEVFARQVRAFGQRGDVLIALTTSGRSRNVLRAIEAAQQGGVQSIALLGKDGGEVTGLADVELLVPHPSTARIQEAHALLYHCLCEMVEATLPRE